MSGRLSREEPTFSSDELTDILVHVGARFVSRHEHGDFLAVRRRLVFVRRASVVRDGELRDVLRSAGFGPVRFYQLLEERIAAREQLAAQGHVPSGVVCHAPAVHTAGPVLPATPTHPVPAPPSVGGVEPASHVPGHTRTY
jgi:hypothetical protein